MIKKYIFFIVFNFVNLWAMQDQVVSLPIYLKIDQVYNLGGFNIRKPATPQELKQHILTLVGDYIQRNLILIIGWGEFIHLCSIMLTLK